MQANSLPFVAAHVALEHLPCCPKMTSASFEMNDHSGLLSTWDSTVNHSQKSTLLFIGIAGQFNVETEILDHHVAAR